MSGFGRGFIVEIYGSNCHIKQNYWVLIRTVKLEQSQLYFEAIPFVIF